MAANLFGEAQSVDKAAVAKPTKPNTGSRGVVSNPVKANKQIGCCAYKFW